MKSFRILHVSDVHFGCPDTAKEQGRITDALVEAAQQFVEQDSREPDVVIFSGDLAFSAAEDQFKSGAEWLSRLIGNWTCPAFLVPGNHDVLRPPKRSAEYQHAYALRTAVATEQGYSATRDSLLSRPHMDMFCQWHESEKSRLRLRSDWSKSRLACSTSIANSRVTAHIIGLNTALASVDEADRGCLVADIGELNSLLRAVDCRRTLSIVISHHPIRPAPRTQEQWLYSWNNEALGLLLGQATGPHLYLHGHVHESSGVGTASNEGNRLFVYGAGAAYQGSTRPQRFAFLDIDLKSMRVHPSVLKLA
jgi:calcineurin-like phosphoesterase family protein